MYFKFYILVKLRAIYNIVRINIALAFTSYNSSFCFPAINWFTFSAPRTVTTSICTSPTYLTGSGVKPVIFLDFSFKSLMIYKTFFATMLLVFYTCKKIFITMFTYFLIQFSHLLFFYGNFNFHSVQKLFVCVCDFTHLLLF